MALACQRPHRLRRLDSDDLVSFGCKPGGIPAGTGTDVENCCAGRWQEVQKGRVHMFEGQRFILGDKLLGVLIVVRNGLHVNFGMFCRLINCISKELP